MQTGSLLESALADEGVLAPDCPDESAWARLWTTEGLGTLAPAAMALRGGLLADRLPWCFIAGYQAAQRQVFPELPDDGWSAFAASEARDDPKEHPATTLTETAERSVLAGTKNWIAQSRHVARLLVTVNGPEGRATRIVLVPAAAPGVSLHHREAPTFLNAMSQGRARFDAVAIDPDCRFAADRARQFARAEPRFVMLACAGFLLGRMPASAATQREDLAALVLALGELCLADPSRPHLLAALDRALQRAADDFERQGLADRVPAWAQDRGLIRLYSRRLQQRAAREQGDGTQPSKAGERQ